MKKILKTTVPMFVINALPLQGLAADNIEFIPANGASFIVTDSTGQQRVLEVTDGGDILINGRLLDVEPPSIAINIEDTDMPGYKSVTVSATDNVAVASLEWRSTGPSYGRDGFYYEGENDVSLDTTQMSLAFGQSTKVQAIAIDQAGNRVVESEELPSESKIIAGTYELIQPVTDTISGQGCQMQYRSPVTFTIETVNVYGEYSGGYGCGPSVMPEATEAVACVRISPRQESNEDQAPLGQGVAALTSITQTALSGESSYASGSSQQGSHVSKVLFDIDFHDTEPASFSASWAMICESDYAGTEKWGPYEFEGVLVE